MPRGRHRHSPPLHRLLAPVTVAVVPSACAGGAWLIGEPGIGDIETVALRALTAVAALAAVTGAVLLRRWDRAAGRRVGDLKAQLASNAWRAEEKQAELEADAEEQRELRLKLDTKLRAKRSELARLRTEHAALLRRYAQAQTDRARALEGGRRREIEPGGSAKALTTAATDHRRSSGAPTPLTYAQADEALNGLVRSAYRQREAEERRVREERTEREREEAEHRARTSAAAAVPPQPEPRPGPASLPGSAPGSTSGPASGSPYRPVKGDGDGDGDGADGRRSRKSPPGRKEDAEDGREERDRAGQSADPDGSSPDTGSFDFFGRSTSTSGATSPS